MFIRSFMILSLKYFAIIFFTLMHRDKFVRITKWLFLLNNSRFRSSVPLYQFQRFNLPRCPNDFRLSVMKYFSSKYVSYPVQAPPCVHVMGYIEIFHPHWISIHLGHWDDLWKLKSRIGREVFFWYFYLWTDTFLSLANQDTNPRNISHWNIPFFI